MQYDSIKDFAAGRAAARTPVVLYSHPFIAATNVRGWPRRQGEDAYAQFGRGTGSMSI